jgi:deoxyribodipyrimidine photo-lyase
LNSESTAIVWFREDLRLHDNPALAHAVENYDRVIPVYLHATNDHDDWSPGAASQWWLHHSLRSLQESLKNIGGRLIIRAGKSATSLLDDLITDVSVDAVFWNRQYAPFAIIRDKEIKSSLKSRGIVVKSFKANLLFEPHEIHKDNGEPYRVFTAFWKRCLQEGINRQQQDAPESLQVPRKIESDAIDSLSLLPRIGWDKGFYEQWQPGEAVASELMDRFIDGVIDHYSNDRDFAAIPGTSRLSPYLHFGEISPAQIVSRVLHSNAAETRAAERYLAEIGWREFAAYNLFHEPATMNESMDKRFAKFPWQQDPEALRRWQEGITGFPIIDAGMRQLWNTGWMHNRVRMIVASFLTKNLMIHWLEGARWFWDTLVDADLASNTLGWQWVAGCGTDAAPYFRIFNPVLQSQKYDPQGNYIRRWIPELTTLDSKAIHEPWKSKVDLDYPDPMVDLKFTRERALTTFKSLREEKRSR